VCFYRRVNSSGRAESPECWPYDALRAEVQSANEHALGDSSLRTGATHGHFTVSAYISCVPMLRVNTAEPSGATLISVLPPGPVARRRPLQAGDRLYFVIGQPNAQSHRFRATGGVVHILVIR